MKWTVLVPALLLSVSIGSTSGQLQELLSSGQVQQLGCWRDTGTRAIPTLEGQDPLLDGSYQARTDAIRKCRDAALKRGYTVFAVQNGGWCASSADALNTYQIYGPSAGCQPDGEGGGWANEVYLIITAQKITFPYPRSVGNYAILGPTLDRDLSSFTLCLHVRIDLSSNDLTSLFSYNAPQQDNELLIFNPGTNNFRLYIGGANVAFGALPVWDKKMHVVCATWSNTNGAWQVYTDGALRGSGTGFKAGATVRSGGKFIIGQEQDTVGGGFEENQAFSGELSLINLWDHVLSPAEMGTVWSDFCNHHGNVIDWTDTDIELFGQATSEPYSCGHTPCQASKGTCTAWGDPHYTTFDGKPHHYQGPCTYTFAKDCLNGDFTVETKNVPRGSVALIREVYVKAFGMEISVLQGRVVKVNGVITSLPYQDFRLEVRLIGRNVRVRLTDLCVEVFYDGVHTIRVDVPRTYMGNMCGLCGNFNGISSDDLTVDGVPVSWTVFGNTHLTDISTCPGGYRGPEEDVSELCDPNLKTEVAGADKCGLLKDPNGPFAACHAVADPLTFFDTCTFDMCAFNGADGLCDNLEAYADACVKAGVASVSWRTADRCPLPCPANSVYSPCTSACPATCVDPDSEQNCDQPCVEGCECVAGYIMSGQSCVPSSQCGCIDEVTGQYYELLEQWGTSDGNHCVCTDGGINCKQETCDEDGGYSWTLVGGVWGCHCTGGCCEKAICKASGDPHFLTPDGLWHHFQGPCTYTFAKDCGSNDFAVETKHVPAPWRSTVSLVRAVWVIVNIDGVTWTICILQGRVVQVNGVTSSLPLNLAGGKIEVRLSGLFVRVELVDLCVVIFYDGHHRVQVEIPSNYQNKLCGLCGNYNGIRGDDYMMPNGAIASNWNEFGNSWKTDTETCDGDDPTGEPPVEGPCDPEFSDPCNVLTDPNGPFAGCHGAVDPVRYLEDCVFDNCASQGRYLCENLEAYYGSCVDEGVLPFVWRRPDRCPLECPANSVYSPCTSACPATCVDPDSEQNCDLPCVEGCECVAGYIMSGQSCVPSSHCGCIDEVTGQYYELGEKWGTTDGLHCKCTEGGTIDCEQVTCDGGSSWTLVDGVWGCHCIGCTCDKAICIASGDPHYTTPDGLRHHFQGPCTYTFAKDCEGNDFAVETKQVPAPWRSTVSLVRAVWVFRTINGYTWRICILQGRVVQVNGKIASLPLSLAGGKIEVRLAGLFVRVELVDLCVVIFYDGNHYVKVEIPSNYRNKLCGLCGNYNGIAGDDYMMPNGEIASNWNDFGNSYKTDTETCDGVDPTGEPPNEGPCDPIFSDPCGLLTDVNGPFADYIGIVDPTPYQEDCVFDMCASKGEIFCENLEGYYDAIVGAGLTPFDWRTPSNCPLECPANSAYSPCTTPCPATCVDRNAPDKCLELICVEGCECNEGFILSGLNCVPFTECGCVDKYGFYHTLGAIWIEGGDSCICKENNNIECKDCIFDLSFTLDRSASIGPYGMYIGQKFIASLIECLKGLDVNVGYICFDCLSKRLVTPEQYTVNTAGLIEAIMAAEYTGAEGRIGSAIGQLLSKAYFRDGIPSVGVLLTDGDAKTDDSYVIQSDEARAQGLELYSVPVGREVFFNYDVLGYIAGGADRVFDRFSGCDLAIKIMQDVCLP